MSLGKVALLLTLPALVSLSCRATAPAPSAEELVARRRLQGLQRLVSAAERGPLLSLDQLLFVVDQRLVQELLNTLMPFEREIDGTYRVQIQKASAEFEDGLALVKLSGTASLKGGGASVDLSVYAGLDVFDLVPESGLLRTRLTVFAVDVHRLEVGGLDAPGQDLAKTLGRERLEVFAGLLPSLPLPVRVARDIDIPAVEERHVRIPSASVPLQVSLQDVKVFRGKLWIAVNAEAAPSPAPAS